MWLLRHISRALNVLIAIGELRVCDMFCFLVSHPSSSAPFLEAVIVQNAAHAWSGPPAELADDDLSQPLHDLLESLEPLYLTSPACPSVRQLFAV